MVKFSNLTLYYEGTKTVSMEWVDMDSKQGGAGVGN